MINFRNGNLLDADLDYICHQVNCQGRMGSGIAKSIKEKWPEVYESYMHYSKYYLERGGPKSMLGSCQYITTANITVINMFAQEGYGYDGKRYTSYDAFWACLEEITKVVPKGSKIGFPDHIGCGLGGANWEVIKTMIYEVLDKDFEVYIYKLEA